MRHSQFEDFFDRENLMQEIEQDSPQNMQNFEIRYFLCDQARNELNSYVLECIKFITKWTAVLKVMDKCFGYRKSLFAHFSFSNKNELETEIFTYDLELYIEVKKLVFLWKHRLSLLEMVAQAQDSLRNF